MRQKPLSLKSFVGQPVVVQTRLLGKRMVLTLRAVDRDGLIFEWPAFTEAVLKLNAAQASPTTPLFFVPFWQVVYVAALGELVSLSEEAFGIVGPKGHE